MIIRDPSTGVGMQVNDEGMGKTSAVSETQIRHANEEEGEAYSIVLDQTPTGVDDCILWLVNNDDKSLLIDAITVFVSGAVELYFQLGDAGIPNAPVALVPVNRNAGSGKTADMTCQQGPDLAAAAVLAGGLEVDRFAIPAAATTAHRTWASGLILPKNGTFTMWSSAVVAVNATIAIFFH